MNDEQRRVQDPMNALRGFLLLDMFVRLLVWSTALSLTLTVFAALDAWPQADLRGMSFPAAWQWVQKLTHMILLFNVFYVLVLVLLRSPIPRPKEGKYSTAPGEPISRQVVWSCLIAVLTKARYQPPFPGFLVFHIANVPPFCWLMGPVFGPRSRSCYINDPTIIDPHHVTIGRNVVIGFGTTIAAHYQQLDHIVIKPTIIEDDVLIGAHTALSGVHIKSGASIAAGSILVGSVVGPGEYWSGNPARRRRVAKADEPKNEVQESPAPK